MDNKQEEKFNKLIDSLPNRVNETPRSVLKRFIDEILIDEYRKGFNQCLMDL